MESLEEARGARHRLLVSLGRIASRVQRARTVEAVLQNAGAGLKALGLKLAVASLRDQRLQLRYLGLEPEALSRLDHFLGESARGASGLPAEGGPLRALLGQTEALFTEDLLGYGLDFLQGRPALKPAQLLGAIETEGLAKAVLAPLAVRGEPWGVFLVCGDALTPGDTAALELFAAQLGSALEVAESIESLARRNRDLAAIHSMTPVGDDSDLARLLGQLQELAAGSTASDCCSIYLLNDTKTELVMLGPPCGVHASLSEKYWRVPVAGTASGAALGRLAPTTVAVEAMPPESRLVLATAGLRHIALVPLAANGRVTGLLSLGRISEHPYDAVDLEGSAFLSGQIAIQLENARLEADTELRLTQLSALFALTRIGSEEEEVAPLLERILDEVLKSVPVDSVLIHFISGAQLKLAGGRASPQAEGILHSLEVLAFDEESLIGRAALHRRTFSASVDELPSNTQSVARSNGIHHVIATPLLSHDRLLGTVAVGRCSKRSFSEQDRKLVESCATQIAIAIDRAKLVEDLRKSYQELALAQSELVKHERLAALGEVAAVMAHEVRNPLGVIFNSIGRLRKMLQPADEARMLFDIVGEEAERLNRIVGDLLDFAKPYEVTRTPVVLEHLIAGAIEATSLVARSTGVEITTHLPRALPPFWVDGDLLRQALVNLVMNAIQAMPGGGQVTVSASAESWRTGQAARIEVTDEGVGIPPENAERIFEPFFTTKVTGTGLGLAVVKRIADAHHGEVAVRSELGKGTTFTLRLPGEAG